MPIVHASEEDRADLVNVNRTRFELDAIVGYIEDLWFIE